MSGLKLKTRGELWLAAGMRRFYATFARRLEKGPAPDFRSHDIGPAAPVPSPRPFPHHLGLLEWRLGAPAHTALL